MNTKNTTSMTIVSAAVIGLVATAVLLVKKKNCREKTDDEDGMPILPAKAVKYSQLPKATDENGKPKVFTKATTPRGLLNRHNTKVGTWGVLTIFKGTLEYKIAPRGDDLRKEVEGQDDAITYPLQFVLDPSSRKGIIEPQRYHKVTPSDDAEFIVEFYRLPNTGIVDEKRD